MSTPITYRELLIDRYALVYAWLPEGCQRVLDVGCGNAIFTAWLRGKAVQVFGIDHNRRNVAQGRRAYPGLHLAVSAGEHLPFPEGMFDAVVCTETLEHVDEDQAAMEEMYRVLAPQGILILTVPQGGLFGWLDGENVVNGFFRALQRLRIPKPGGGRILERFRYRRHRHYSVAQLRQLLGERFEVERVYQGGLLLYPLLYLIEKCLESFGGVSLVEADYRFLRLLRAWDFTCAYGRWAFNLALRARKTK